MSSFLSATFFSDGFVSDFSSVVGVGVAGVDAIVGAAGTAFFVVSEVPDGTTLPVGARRLAASEAVNTVRVVS
jgi:hypothetical protein